MSDFISSAGVAAVRVRTPEANRLVDILRPHATSIEVGANGILNIEGLTSDDIGIAAAGAQITLFELANQAGSLEEAYMKLTEQSVDFHTHTTSDGDHQ
jgi:ABC-2 type transport system ATP-binding protein